MEGQQQWRKVPPPPNSKRRGNTLAISSKDTIAMEQQQQLEERSRMALKEKQLGGQGKSPPGIFNPRGENHTQCSLKRIALLKTAKIFFSFLWEK
jgi:hypothetical protein